MDLSTAYTAMSSAVDFVKTAIQARDEARINEALAEIQQKRVDLSMAAIELIEKSCALAIANSELANKVAELERKLNERTHYALFEVAPGRFVYRFVPDEGDSNPEHYVCQLCYDKGIKSVLRFYATMDGHSKRYACAACESGAHDVHV